MITKKRLAGVTGIVLPLAVAATAFGHAGFMPKSVDPLYDGQSYKEGTTADLTLIPAHGCSDAAGNAYATEDVYAVFPNTQDLSAFTFTSDGTQSYAGNALMAIRPAVDANFQRVERRRGAVPQYFNHGPQSEDVRALRWIGGLIPEDMYAELHLRASMPRLKGCVERLRVFVPTVQYCRHGTMSAWIREATPGFPAEVISPGYAPYIDVVRDYDHNPLPASCAAGESREAYPTASDIDRYLKRR